MVGGQGGVSSPSLGCGPACARVGWPYKCTVWRAMALKIGAHSCNNTTPFWLMLVWLNTTPCYPLPGDGSRSGDINTTIMMCCCCASFFFVFARDPTNDHHHALRPRRIIIQSSWKKWCWSRKSGWRRAGLLSIYMKFVAFPESLGFLYVSLSKLVLLDSCTGRPYCSL